MLDNGDFTGIAQEVTDMAVNESMEAVGEALAPSTEEVRAAARELLQYAQQLSVQNGTVAEQIANLNTESESSVLNFSKKMVKSKEEFVNLMKRVDTFQNIVNAFLGQVVQMVFVWVGSGGQVKLYSLSNSVESLGIDKTSSKRGGLYTGKYRNGIAKRMGELIQAQNNYNQSSLDDTFKEVWARFNISKAKLKLRGAALILWNLNGTWDGRWISGAGPLGEAYVSFFLNEYVFSGGMEYNVMDFMTNSSHGAELADNASGFLQGDVTKGNIEYGVKMNNAQSLGYIDIIKYAQEVLETTDVKAYLQNLKEELNAKGIKNMVRPIAEKMKDEYEPGLQAIQNAVAKRIEVQLPIS